VQHRAGRAGIGEAANVGLEQWRHQWSLTPPS
jgi:hypothetical protein